MQPARISIESAAAPHLDGAFSYAMTGCHRISHLVWIYREARRTSGKTKGRAWPHLTDILRAGVVLCHAILEQLLRDLMAIEADWTKEFLQRIPLADSPHVRGEKFTLADLHEHGDVSVSELVRNSVYEHLQKRSFTEVRDVIEVLQMCHIEIDPLRSLFSDLADLMERRHHIAHTADIDEDRGRGHQMTRSISARQVERWNGTLVELIARLSFRPPTKTLKQ